MITFKGRGRNTSPLFRERWQTTSPILILLVPNKSIAPMWRISHQFDEFVEVWEKAHKNQTKNDIYKISKSIVLQNKGRIKQCLLYFHIFIEYHTITSIYIQHDDKHGIWQKVKPKSNFFNSFVNEIRSFITFYKFIFRYSYLAKRLVRRPRKRDDTSSIYRH